MSIRQHHYWWVNHKQTFKAEIEGGYIWSPKKNQDGRFNQTYENLNHVQPGDVVISYADALIKAIGIATGKATEQGKPKEFGKHVGENWSEDEGWLVPIEWTTLTKSVTPKVHINQIAPLLPEKHSPIQVNGNGNQGCYLASISDELGQLILSIAGHEEPRTPTKVEAVVSQIEEDQVQEEILKSDRQSTEKEQLVRARQGQGLFRQRVMMQEKCCRITGVTDDRFLIASHIKPWRHSDDLERLDGENGLLLAPHVDKLFDGGWISFEDNGALLVTDEAATVIDAWGIKSAINVGVFTTKQRDFLQYHRQHIFKSNKAAR
jgi:putative restriction endonuclease